MRIVLKVTKTRKELNFLNKVKDLRKEKFKRQTIDSSNA